VAPGIGDVPVPPLSLQPLVENAVRHGIAPRPEGGRLDVEIGRSGETLRVRVEDDGPGPGGSREHGAGAALADLRKRLELLYADRASLELDRGPLGGCRVTLRLPCDPGESVPSGRRW
jgi:LytS/YehU family sensor histidine kinase